MYVPQANITCFQHGGSGFYFDSSSNAMSAHHNLVYNVSGSLMQWNTQDGHPMLRGAEPSRFWNNVFVASRLRPGTPTPLFIWNGYTRAEFTRNVVLVSNDRPVLFAGTTCRQKHEGTPRGRDPRCTDVFRDNFRLSNFSGNTYWNTSGALSPSFPSGDGGMRGLNVVEGRASLAAWQAAGHDRDSVQRDPLFRDAAHSDFHLLAGSPALALGFEQLQLGDAGPDWLPTSASADSGLDPNAQF